MTIDTHTLLEAFEEIENSFKDLFRRITQLEAEPKLLSASGGGAPVDATYLVNTANVVLTNEIVVTAAQGRIIYGDGTPTWTTLNIGTQYQILGVNVAGTQPEWQTFDWDNQIITAGGDGVHTHANAPEGGQIDHAVGLTNVTEDQHHNAFIGLEDTVNTQVSPAVDNFIELNSTSAALTILSVPGNNRLDFTVNIAGLTHNLLSAIHPDTVPSTPPGQGSIIVANASPLWAEVTHPGTAYHFQTTVTDAVWAQNITMATGAWVGIGAGAGHITFTDAATDTVTVLNANFGIGTAVPEEMLHLLSSVSFNPRILLENTNADAIATRIELYKNSVSPADGDDLGLIGIFGETSTGAKERYAHIVGESLDITNGDTGGGLKFVVLMDATERSMLEIAGYNGVVNQGTVTINNDAQDVDFYVEAFGVTDALFVQGSDGQITLGVLGAGVVQSSAGGVLSSGTVPLVDIGGYAEGSLIIGGAADWETLAEPGAAGYALISDGTTFVWDQTPTWTGLHTFAAGITLAGASGANNVTVPDNVAIAIELLDAGGTEYLRIISNDAQPIIHFNEAGVDIDYRVKAVGVADALAIRGNDGQVTLGVLGAGFVRTNAGGVLSSSALIAGDLPAHAAEHEIGGGDLVDHNDLTNYVANEHVDHTAVTLTAGAGLTGGGTIVANRTFAVGTGNGIAVNANDVALNINGLAAAGIAAGDFVPFWDITVVATNKKITFANFEATLAHNNLIAGTIVSHDTAATGAELTSLTDDSIVNTLHRHSELVASDGAPDPALSVNADGDVGIGTTTIPHGGIGAAKFAIDGPNGSTAGPHVQFTTSSDNYPLFQILNHAHDNIGLSFDAYWDNGWYSSDVGSNFQIYKNGDLLRFGYDSGIAQGAAITWNNGIVLDTSGNVGIRTVPATELHVATNDGACVLRLEDTSANSQAVMQLKNDARQWSIKIDTSDLFRVRDDTAGSNRLTINTLGYLGVNSITLPATAFDIGAGAMTMAEIGAPGAGAANIIRTYAVDIAGISAFEIVNSTGDTVSLNDDGIITSEEIFEAYVDVTTRVTQLAEDVSGLVRSRTLSGPGYHQFATIAAVAGAVITIIAGGAEDVTQRMLYNTIVKEIGAGLSQTAQGELTPGNTVDIYDNGGTNILVLDVGVGGNVTIYRNTTGTYDVFISTSWI